MVISLLDDRRELDAHPIKQQGASRRSCCFSHLAQAPDVHGQTLADCPGVSQEGAFEGTTGSGERASWSGTCDGERNYRKRRVYSTNLAPLD